MTQPPTQTSDKLEGIENKITASLSARRFGDSYTNLFPLVDSYFSELKRLNPAKTSINYTEYFVTWCTLAKNNSNVPATIVRAYRNHRLELKTKNDAINRLPQIGGINPSSVKKEKRTVSEPMYAEMDDYMVISDVESPDFHWGTFVLAMAYAKAHNVKNLVIAGDFIAGGAYSQHEKRFIDIIDPNHEIETTRMLLDAIMLRFDSVWWHLGNHEDVLTRGTDGALSFKQIYEGDGRYYETQNKSLYMDDLRNWMVIKTKFGYTLVQHMPKYNRMPLRIGQDLHTITNVWNHLPSDMQLSVPRELKFSHIIVPHTHIPQTGSSVDGNCIITANGTMRDAQITNYTNVKMGTYPAWENTFIHVEDGIPKTLYYNPRRTNWVKELESEFTQQILTVWEGTHYYADILKCLS